MPYQTPLDWVVEQIGCGIVSVGFAVPHLMARKNTARTVVAQELLTVSTTTPDQIVAGVVAVIGLDQGW